LFRPEGHALLILIVAGGPDKGRIYQLYDDKEVVLGREGDQVKLNDHKVSREHARLWCEGGRWYLRDLASRHGTYRNHQLITNRQPLKDGDYLQIGNTVLVVARVPAEAADELARQGEAQTIAAAAPGRRAGRSDRQRTRPALLVAAGLALLLLLGLNLALYLSNQQADQRLQDELIASRQIAQQAAAEMAGVRADLQAAQADNRRLQDQRLAEVRGMVERSQQREPQVLARLDDINDELARNRMYSHDVQQLTGEVRRLGNQSNMLLNRFARVLTSAEDQTEAMQEMTAQVEGRFNALPDELARTLDEVLTQIDRRPTTEQVDASVQRASRQAREAGETMAQRVLASLDAQPSMEQIAQAINDASTGDRQQTEELVHQVLVRLDDQPSRDQIADAVAEAVRQDLRQQIDLTTQVLAALEAQPDTLEVAGMLRQELARDRAQTDSMIRQVHSALGGMPSAEALAAELTDAIAPEQRQTRQLVERALASLEARPSTQQLAEAVRAELSGDTQQTDALVQQVLEQVGEQPTAAQLVAALERTLEADRQDHQRLAQQVLDALGDAPSAEALAEAVATALDADARRSDALVEQVLLALEQRPTRDELEGTVQEASLAAAEASAQRMEPAMERIVEALALDGQPTDEQMQHMRTALMEHIEQVLAEGTDASVERLAAQARDLAATQDTPDPVLAEVLRVVDAQQQTLDRLEQVHRMLEQQPEATDALVREAVGAVAARVADQGEQDVNRALQMVLREVRENMQREALMLASASPAPASRVQLASPLAGASANVTAGPGSVMAMQTSRSGRPLSAVESAYMTAFESGEPMTIGAGLMNPATGEVSRGRTIDPAAARAEGVTDWREWYLMDDMRQRMRLQVQARESRDDGRDVRIRLPRVEPDGQ
jgi:hypothetical protein